MRNSIVKTALTAASLLLAASLSFAVDIKVPDVKGAAKATADSAKTGAKAAAKAKLVDINTATEAQLKAIPGLGDAYVAKIIAGRPYANKAQLKPRKILSDAVYEKVKDLIIATQPKK